MNKTVFSQLDRRWAGLPYPVKPWTLSTSGCGCVSVTHLLIETGKYKKYTPKDVQPYMKQFAIAGQGTLWSGIKTSLEHYGFKVINHSTMTGIFDTLKNRKQKMGIILFRKGTKGGVTWTTSGHFVAFLDYKVSNGKHYFYVKDSGGRRHTGWYCYETQMKGLIPQIWSALPPAEPKKVVKTAEKQTYKIKFAKNGGSGSMQTITCEVGKKIKLPKNLFKRTDFEFVGWSVGKSKYVNMDHFQLGKVKYKNEAAVKDLAAAGKTVTLYACWKGCGALAACLWARKIAKDNSFMYGAASGIWNNGRDRAHQVGCYFCGTTRTGPKRAKKGSDWEKTYCCNSFVVAAFVHGANLAEKCVGGSTRASWWPSWKPGGKRRFKILGTNLKYSELPPATVLCSGTHVKLFTGNGMINRVTHAAGEGWTKKSIRTELVSGRIGEKYTAVKFLG